jgi:hypothetical protein
VRVGIAVTGGVSGINFPCPLLASGGGSPDDFTAVGGLEVRGVLTLSLGDDRGGGVLTLPLGDDRGGGIFTLSLGLSSTPVEVGGALGSPFPVGLIPCAVSLVRRSIEVSILFPLEVSLISLDPFRLLDDDAR